MELRLEPSEVEGGSTSEVTGCAPSEEIRGAYQYSGKVWWWGRWCLDSTSKDTCNLQVGLDYRGPKR